MNFIALLKSQHKETKDGFKKILSQEPLDRDLTEKVCQKLLLHMELEEKYFYPLMKKRAEEESVILATEAQLEHSEAKKPLKSLLANHLEDIEYKVKLELLQLEITHHIEEEEKEFFPMAQKLLSEEEIQEITRKMEVLMDQKLTRREFAHA